MSLIASKISNLLLSRKEHYTCVENQEKVKQYQFSLLDLVIILVSFYAVYLSWSCNTMKKVDLLLKLIYAFFAFLFGMPYVLFYAVFKEKLTPC